MKTFVASLACSLTLLTAAAGAQVPRVLAKVGGRVNNKGVRSISADGRAMTIKVVTIAPNGQETPITLVFKRVSA